MFDKYLNNKCVSLILKLFDINIRLISLFICHTHRNETTTNPSKYVKDLEELDKMKLMKTKIPDLKESDYHF